MKLRNLVILLLISGCINSQEERLDQIANELLQIEEITNFKSNRNSPIEDVVNIGPGLHQILMNRKIPIDSITIEIRKRDFIKENKSVSHSIFYYTNNSRLGLRMKYDKEIDKFHIVGYIGNIK